MTTTIEVSETIAGTPDELWRACADPLGIAGWQADEAEGNVVLGGHLILRWPGLDTSIELAVDEIREGERLVLRGGPQRVAFEVAPGRVSVSHSGPLGRDAAAGVASSWQLSLALLRHALECHGARTRRVLWAARSMRTRHDQAHVFFTDSHALGSWLVSRGTSIGERSSAYAFETLWGEPMSGTVLCRVAERDVLVSWSEMGDSALAFRTLPSPFHPEQRLVALAWSRWRECPRPARVQRELTRALQRLGHLIDNPATA
jgi:uncharacterized protein YndB with AHSA1/START domain